MGIIAFGLLCLYVYFIADYDRIKVKRENKRRRKKK